MSGAGVAIHGQAPDAERASPASRYGEGDAPIHAELAIDGLTGSRRSRTRAVAVDRDRSYARC